MKPQVEIYDTTLRDGSQGEGVNFSVADKLRIVALRRRVRRGDPAALLAGDDTSTITELRNRGFSDDIIDRFFRPLVGGIQLDPNLLTSRRMFDIIFRSLADGDSVVPAGGMGAIPAQLSAGLAPGTVQLNRSVSAVDGTTVLLADGSTIEARTVVVATEGPAAAQLLSLKRVESRAVGCVYFAADKAPISTKLVVLDGNASGPVLNVAVMSNVAPSYAPEGQHLIAAAMPTFISGDIEAMARRQLREWWGEQVDTWRHLATYRIAHGQPDQSPPFSPKRRVDLGDGIFVCGDHRDTGSIQGALFSGRRCGEAVAAATS